MLYETEIKTVMRESILVKERKELHIPINLDSNLYQRLKGVLARLEIQWDRSKACHIFDKDPSELIQQYLDTSSLPKLNPTAFFPTPSNLTKEVFEEWLDFDTIDYFARCEPGKLDVLEPSAGTGGIADEIREYFGDAANIDTVEYLPENAQVLRDKGYNVHNIDFLDYQPSKRYDYIIMNPPFSLMSDRSAYITHIRHAQTMLKPRGKLIAFLPCGWTIGNTRKEREFRDFVATYQSTNLPIRFPKGAFKASGTMIETMAIELDNEMPNLVPHEANGFPNWGSFWFSVQSDAMLTDAKNSTLCNQRRDIANCQDKSKLKELLKPFVQGARDLLAKQNLFFTDSVLDDYRQVILETQLCDITPEVKPFDIEWQKTKGGYEQSTLAF